MRIKNQGWQKVLKETFEDDGYKAMWAFLEERYETGIVYPPKEEVYSAFELVDYEDVRVVILGQDPYHGPGQAHGLSFSVQPSVRIPPSLRNMYKELVTDMGVPMPKDGYLVPWAKQGILMMNAVLTVEQGQAGAHKKIGWHKVTDGVIQKLNERETGIVFVLWGNFAISKKKLITGKQHRIIESAHPSPLSARRGFFGSRPYSTVNAHLKALGQEPIDWRLPSL